MILPDLNTSKNRAYAFVVGTSSLGAGIGLANGSMLVGTLIGGGIGAMVSIVILTIATCAFGS